MTEEAVVVRRRRQYPPEIAARREERKLLAASRKTISALQSRLAYAAARAISNRPPDRSETDLEYSAVRALVVAEAERVETLMKGCPGVGPADDCRRALVSLLSRLPQ